MGQLAINKSEKKKHKTSMPLFGVLAAQLRKGTGKSRKAAQWTSESIFQAATFCIRSSTIHSP